VTVRALREVSLVAGLAAIGVALPLAINAAAGVLDIPYSDEFTFRQTALHLWQTGELRLGGWSIMTFVGQLVAVQPVLALSGGAGWAFPATAAAFMAAGIAAGYALARRLLAPGSAAVAVLLVLTFPGVLVVAPTFMTDIPAWAAELACLALAVPALDRRVPGRRRGRILVLALAAGVLAFSIREFGLAAPVAVLLVMTVGSWLDARRGATPIIGGRALVLAWALALGVCLAVYVVTSSLPGQAPARLHPPGDADLRRARQAVATTALAVAPALVLAGTAWLRRRSWRDRWSMAGLAGGLALGLLVYASDLAEAVRGGLPVLVVGNVLSAAGSTGSGAGAGIRPVLFVPPTWKLLNLLALASVLAGTALAGAWVGRVVRQLQILRSAALTSWQVGPRALLATFSILYLGGTLAFGLIGSLFDRYLWPTFLPLAVLLLAEPPPAPAGRVADDPAGRVADRAGQAGPAGPAPPGRRVVQRLDWSLALGARAVAVAIVVGLAAASLALVLNRAAFDAARWEAGRALVAAGIPADRIDAGYEWVGHHADQIVTANREPGPGERWYHLIVPEFRPCAIVASSSLVEPGIELRGVSRSAYRLLLVGGPPGPLYDYRTEAAGCP
jgi:hypothetical protein